jgi:hypothetical protein
VAAAGYGLTFVLLAAASVAGAFVVHAALAGAPRLRPG